MADVTGPISSLPGTIHQVPKGMKCDNHPKRFAQYRIQGETDSMGCEMIDLCLECFQEDVKRTKEEGPPQGTCDWCKAREVTLKPVRDYEEGLNGPVYYVCQGCSDRQAKRLQQEMDDIYDDWEEDDRPRRFSMPVRRLEPEHEPKPDPIVEARNQLGSNEWLVLDKDGALILGKMYFEPRRGDSIHPLPLSAEHRHTPVVAVTLTVSKPLRTVCAQVNKYATKKMLQRKGG